MRKPPFFHTVSSTAFLRPDPDVPARIRKAAAALRACVDSIDAASPPASAAPIIAMGDFNATPAEINPALPGFENLASPLAAAGEGSLKSRGTWELIDQFWVRGAPVRMSVFRPPFLLEPDTGYSGERPRRTFSGPRYKGGLSDHLPVVLVME